MLDKRTRLAYFNGLVFPHLDYADDIWGDQPDLTSEMQEMAQQLQTFQNRFAKKIVDMVGGKLSSAEALVSLKWFPLHGRRFGHRRLIAQNVIKGDIPEHFEIFRTPLSQLPTAILGMVFSLHFPSRELNGEDGQRILKVLTIGLPCLLHLRDQCRA